MSQQNRAYSLLTIKAVDDDQRIIEGIATTPSTDRVGDVIESKGAEFKLPIPLLLHHDSRQPIGEVFSAKVTPDGIAIKARIARTDEPGKLKDRLDEAWQSIKLGLIRGLSIGFSDLKSEPIPGTYGLRFLKWLWLELSAVTIPANAEASILAIKSLDAPFLANHPGDDVSSKHVNHPHRPGTPVVRLLPTRQEKQMKSISEQITSWKSTRDQKWTEMNEIMSKAAESGQSLDAEESDKYEAAKAEVKAADVHIARLEEMESFQKSAAKPAVGGDPQAAHASRGGAPAPVIHVRSNEEPGIGFTRAVICKALAAFHGGSPIDYAKARYADNDRVVAYLKATIPAGTTTDPTWASPLVDPTNLASEFIEFLRPRTIIGQFGTNGIPALSRVPFNVRISGQTSGGDAYWVGQGAPKPLTKFDFNNVTLTIAKVAAISVITEELARLSTPSAEARVRDGLAKAVIARIDTDFIDPTQAAVANVSPASITNGVTPLAPSGTTADAARADVARLIKEYLDDNSDPASLVLIMPTALALSLSVQVNSLGQQEFPGLSMQGGKLLGLPVIASQYAANQSGAGNLVIAVNAADIFLADDGQVTVDASREASLQMLDNPTNSSATGTATTMVSMFQTNSIALRAERFINWQKARTNAVAYMDDVNWGSIGSPA